MLRVQANVNMIDSEKEAESEVPKDDWMNSIIDYLKDSKLPEDRNQARKLRLKAAKHTLIDEVLLRKSFSGP